jgi:hypothetical protein
MDPMPAPVKAGYIAIISFAEDVDEGGPEGFTVNLESANKTEK